MPSADDIAVYFRLSKAIGENITVALFEQYTDLYFVIDDESPIFNIMMADLTTEFKQKINKHENIHVEKGDGSLLFEAHDHFCMQNLLSVISSMCYDYKIDIGKYSINISVSALKSLQTYFPQVEQKTKIINIQ
jgi:hypothetical protein